jgi:Ca-activated chloride channel family protein
MRQIRVTAACCVFALVAGCATHREAGGDNDSIVVTAQRADGSARDNQGRNTPPPPAPPSYISAPSPPMVSMPNVVAPAMTTGSVRADNKAMRQERYAGSFVPPVVVATDPGTERYDGKSVSAVKIARSEPVSTFSVDVDTGAYANARRFLTAGQMPPKDAVRSEEMINYFRYNYPMPESRAAPFSVSTDVMVSPWNPDTRLMRIGLRGYDIAAGARPPANLVFLIDVSGSMTSADKLPLVKSALAGLAGELSPRDKVSIVVYAGAAGLVLEPTNDPAKIRAVLDRLEAGGSTAGGAGLQLAYQVARDSFITGGVNRILLATDGDFNVGVSDTKALIEMVERERDHGITLTTLGFGEGNYNEAMMEQVADHGNGNYAYIDSALEARKVLGDEMGATLFTIAKDVKIQVEFNPAQVSQYRLLGYENRALREEDFNNDKVDAGDIGAGHQVTAIYEFVPTGSKGWIADRRYEPASAGGAGIGGEIAFVKLRYKLPDGTTSKLIEQPVPASLMMRRIAPNPDFLFAASVVAFGQTLRGDPLMQGYSYAQIAALAGRQDNFWRQEFIRLVGVADGMRRD